MRLLTILRRFARLPPADRALLLRIGALVAVVRVVLWTRPWPRVLRLVRALPMVLRPRHEGARGCPDAARDWYLSADRATWAVRHASRLVPAATCLTQSLALQCALTAMRV